jgi:hypothetical protein
MPSAIQSFFATIDPISPPPQQLWNSALRQNQPHRNETFKLKLLRWRRRVLPPGLPAVRREFQRHRLATRYPYAQSMTKDRLDTGTRRSGGPFPGSLEWMPESFLRLVNWPTYFHW